MDDKGGLDVLAIREPRQQRTREQWVRVLDTGLALLEEGGYEAFTIAAVCERAQVPPRALYARTDTKDGLFLAVYEHGMTRVAKSHRVFVEPDGWDLAAADRIEKAVGALVQIFLDNAEFLRAIVLTSGAHQEVARRGQAHRSQIGSLFSARLAPLDDLSPLPNPERAREFCFTMVFSSLVVRSAYGPGFGYAGNEQELLDDLVLMAQRYLLAL